MVSFVVETYVPGGDRERFATDADGIRVAVASIGAEIQVHYLRSYFVPSDEMGFHVVEANSAEDVARVTELAGIEVERIVEAIGVGTDRAADPGRTETPRIPFPHP